MMCKADKRIVLCFVGLCLTGAVVGWMVGCTDNLQRAVVILPQNNAPPPAQARPPGVYVEPASIELSRPEQRAQLRVFRVMDDGLTEEDLTTATTGTFYTVDSLAIASVSKDGLVAPVARGQSKIGISTIHGPPLGEVTVDVRISRPPAVHVDPLPAVTILRMIGVTGKAGPNDTLEIATPVKVYSAVADDNGVFSQQVELAENRANQIFVTPKASGGQRGSPVTRSVTHDARQPNLFIDFPPDSSTLTTESIDVAGRVGDILSGYSGLSVKVNDKDALVNVGVGNNGTFLAASVPLVLGANSLTATATDAAGNTVTRAISVTRVAVPVDALRLSVESGNGQQAAMRHALADPIVVKAVKPDGSPFANKLITFQVARSDGRLSADGQGEGAMLFQVRTGADGLARAFWKMGSDAGRGNNRVEVTSRGLSGNVFFCASSTPGPSAQINIGSGNMQQADAGGPLAMPLRAWVSDSCNGIAGVAVKFRVLQGAGRLSGIDTNGNAAEALDELATLTSRTGHASVNLTLGPDAVNNIVEANFDGNTTGPATFIAVGRIRDEARKTTFVGLVQDNAFMPIGGAPITLRIGDSAPQMTQSADNGTFRFEDVPGAGPGQLDVEAFAAKKLAGKDIAEGSFPNMHYQVLLTPNAENSIGMPVMLPPLNPANRRMYSTTQDTVLTCEGMDGLKMTIRAGSMKSGDGKPAPDGAIVSLNQVHHDEVPMPMPDGVASPFAWTFQPAGMHFDPPVAVEYPNMSSLPPGAVANFLSFDHETNRFEIVASGTVAADGSAIRTDRDAGITVSGWGCNCPPYAIRAECANCFVSIGRYPRSGRVCVDEVVEFRAKGSPTTGTYSWTGGQAIGGTQSSTYKTKFSSPGFYTVSVNFKCPGDAGYESSDSVSVEAIDFGPPNKKIPLNSAETTVVGPAETHIKLCDINGPPLFRRGERTLGRNGICQQGDVFTNFALSSNPAIVYKDEEAMKPHPFLGSPYPAPYPDHLMLPQVSAASDRLAELVLREWADENNKPTVSLRIVDAFDEEGEHGGCGGNEYCTKPSTHYEARAVDMTTSPVDSNKLCRLGILAALAGFEWVYYEGNHIHASMSESSLTAPTTKVHPSAAKTTELDGPWTIAVNGQIAPTSTDGTYLITDIAAPDQFGPDGPGSPPDFVSDDFVRVIAISDANGPRRYGFSEYFQLRDGETFVVGPLTITDTPPLAIQTLSLDVAVGQRAILSTLRDTSQLRLNGVSENGTQVDVTPRSKWTTYRTSNPQVASVGPNGLVTAIGAGTAYITAGNDGATAVTRILVAPGDPLTTVEGFVVDEAGQPVASAAISIIGQPATATSDASGRFVVAGVATTLGNIIVQARTNNMAGSSEPLPPVPAAITDAGVLRLMGGTTGQEFIVAFQQNEGPTELTLFISGNENTAGEVQCPGVGFTRNFDVKAGEVTMVALPPNAIVTGSNVTVDRGILITTGRAVSVYGLNRRQYTTDAFTAFPTATFGTRYRAMCYQDGRNGRGQFAVVASQDATTVMITPTAATSTRTAGQTYSVTLNRLQAYQLQSDTRGEDLSGTLIVSDKPVGVFGGHVCANVPTDNVNYCDHLCEQIPPVPTWGKMVLTLPLATRRNGDTFRILADQDTAVRISGPSPAMFTLAAGAVSQRILTGNNIITADRPILVVQLSNGTDFDGVVSDPFMTLVPPFEQFLNRYTFATPGSGFPTNFVNIIAPTIDALGGVVMLDGAPVAAASFQSIAGSDFSCAKLPLSVGQHRMAGPRPFGIYVYGFAPDDSYGYVGGLSLAPLP